MVLIIVTDFIIRGYFPYLCILYGHIRSIYIVY